MKPTSTITNGYYPRVSRSFAVLTVALLIAFFRNVIDKMTNNTSFQTPAPNPPLADVKTAVDDLEVKNQAAMGGDRVAIAARNAGTAVLLNLGRQLGNYVETMANGNLDVLLSSGFDAVKAPTPSVIPDVPSNATLAAGDNTGTMMFRYTGGSNVRNYSIQYSENATGPWIDYGLWTNTRVLLEGLTAGKVYWARACANGAAGTSDWSSPVSLMAV